MKQDLILICLTARYDIVAIPDLSNIVAIVGGAGEVAAQGTGGRTRDDHSKEFG